MATARILDSFWTCSKRKRLELILGKRGHAWPADPNRGPMSAGECVARILAFLDTRGDPEGGMLDLAPADVEAEAGWVGAPGLLWEVLVSVGFVDVAPGVKRWHDYASFNSKTISARNRKAAQEARERAAASARTAGGTPGGAPQEAPERERERETPRERGRETPREKVATSGSGSGSGSGSESGFPSQRGEETRAAAAAPSSPDGADPSPPARKGKRAHREPEPPSPEARGLAHELRAAIREHTPEFKGPASLDEWARHIDRALRLDGRKPDELREVIGFAHRDPRGAFWRSNLLCGATLRKHADRLRIEAKRPATNGRGDRGEPHVGVEGIREMKRRLKAEGR